MDNLPYRKDDPQSILEYANTLVGSTLRKACGLERIGPANGSRGAIGTAVERHFFKYDPNSSPNMDFPEAGLELKVSAMKLAGGRLVPKERLSLSMINYEDVISETWESSALAKKIGSILLMYYIYDSEKDPVDFEFCKALIWSIPEEDLLQVKQDWQTIVDKVRSGQAHTISERDTMYLSAAPKAASAQDVRRQPNSPIPAMPRAWAFKRSYMESIMAQDQNAPDVQFIERAIEEASLPLEQLIARRFSKYIGLTEMELAQAFKLNTGNLFSAKPKNLGAMIAKRILGVDDSSQISEFQKAGIQPKAIRLNANGMPKEAMSFPSFSFQDVATQTFQESELYDQLTRKYLFIVFRQDEASPLDYRLSEARLWQMPDEDLPSAERCYVAMQQNILSGRAGQNVSSKMGICCHVRPHARNAQDKAMAPDGKMYPKKSFWLNKEYIAHQFGRPLQLGLEVGSGTIHGT